MSEETLSDSERASILGAVAALKPKKVEEAVASGEQPTFGSLLEQTLERRAIIDKQDVEVDSKFRARVIKESRLDLIGELKF